MRYMLLIYNNPATYEAFSEEERDALFGEVDGLLKELTESGEWVGGEGLADASTAKTVRVRSGAPAVTDGPFVEAKEQLAGYCIVECESFTRNSVPPAARAPSIAALTSACNCPR